MSTPGLRTLRTGRHEPAPETLGDFGEEGSQQVQHQVWVQVWQHGRTPPQLRVGGRQNDLEEVWQPGGEVLLGRQRCRVPPPPVKAIPCSL